MGHHRPPYLGLRLTEAAAETLLSPVQPAAPPRTKTVLLLSEARSGSTWIAELLAYHLQEHHGIMLFGLAGEHFAGIQWDATAQDVRETLDSLYLDQHGFRGSKILCPAMSVICMLGQAEPDLLQRFFGRDTYWIVVSRRDRIAQAVSLAHAWTNDRFHAYADDAVAESTQVTPARVSDALSAILHSEAYLEAMAGRIAPDRQLVVHYEDVLADHAAFLTGALRLLGIPAPTDPAALKDSTKVRKLAAQPKLRDQRAFLEWLLCNHHHVPTVRRLRPPAVTARAPDSQSTVLRRRAGDTRPTVRERLLAARRSAARKRSRPQR